MCYASKLLKIRVNKFQWVWHVLKIAWLTKQLVADYKWGSDFQNILRNVTGSQ